VVEADQIMIEIYRSKLRSRCIYITTQRWSVRLGRQHNPLFSERYGYTKWRYLFGGRISTIRRRADR
jgi:hypothetical protein